MASREQWVALREIVTDLAERHLPQMEPDSLTHCEPFISDLIQLCDAALLLYSSTTIAPDVTQELSILDSFRVKIVYFDPSDETSFLNLAFNRDLHKLNRTIDQMYLTMSDDLRQPKAQAIRVSPIMNSRYIDDRLKMWRSQTNEIKRNMDEIARTDVPEFKFGKIQVYRNRISASITVFNVNLSGTVFIPWGLIKNVAGKIRENWQKIIDDDSIKKARNQLEFYKKTEILTGQIESLRADIEDEERWRLASQIGGKKNIDDLIVDFVKSGRAPPPEYAQQGRILNLADSGLTNLTLLKDCLNITYLNLDQNTELDDIDGLTTFAKLEFLRMSDTMVSDLSFIRSLKALTSFDIRGTEVSDLSPFEGNLQIESLNIRATKITNLTSLGGLQNLRYLNVSLLREPSNIMQIATLKNLKTLDIRDVQNASELLSAGLLGVQRLNISRCPIMDVEWVRLAGSLEKMVARNCAISDWRPLIGTSLTELTVAANQQSLAADQLQGSGIVVKVIKDSEVE